MINKIEIYEDELELILRPLHGFAPIFVFTLPHAFNRIGEK